jgi:hypothetical protein
MGRYWDYDTIAGDSAVVSVGMGYGGGFSVSGDIGQITGQQGSIGTSLSVNLGVGYSTPISLSGLACHTELLSAP